MSTLYFSTILWPVIISANISYIVCMHLLGLAGFETFLYLGFWPARSVATFCMSSYLLAGFKPKYKTNVVILHVHSQLVVLLVYVGALVRHCQPASTQIRTL